MELVGQIRQRVEAITGKTQPEVERRFHKHRDYLTYGLKTADMRRLAHTLKPQVLKLGLEERFNLVGDLFATQVGELGHIGIQVLAFSLPELEAAHFPHFDAITECFTSWSHVDHLCGVVMQPLLLCYPEQSLEFMESWNQSPFKYKRRASVVVFTRKVGISGHYLDETMAFCENLVWDPEDIVQKGVGWALKDALRASPARVLPYIMDLRRRGAPSTITLYAIRGLSPELRQEVLAVKGEHGGRWRKVKNRGRSG